MLQKEQNKLTTKKKNCLPNSSNTNIPPLFVPHFLILLSSMKDFGAKKRQTKRRNVSYFLNNGMNL